jgi:hypothetical protein
MEITSLGVQVHGGMGFVEETGAAQHMRDARILPIYEGTNGIQALDLIGRKFLRDGGAGLKALAADMREVAAALEGTESAAVGAALSRGIDALEQAGAWIKDTLDPEGINPGTAAYSFMMLAGTVAGGWQMAVAARAARQKLAAGEGNAEFLRAKLVTARFYADQIMPRALAYLEAVRAGGDSTMALEEAHFCL